MTNRRPALHAFKAVRTDGGNRLLVGRSAVDMDR
jgi:hypothetical protein